MRVIATHVARSVVSLRVCLSVCVSVCWSWPWYDWASQRRPFRHANVQ